MKREIEFRGKTRNKKKWIYGFYCAEYGNDYIISSDSKNPLSVLFPRLVAGETVGQYIGIKDKNSKKIYEDDIVKAWSTGLCAIGVITWRSDGIWIIFPAWQQNQFWNLSPNHNGVDMGVEVIGNIHDNPDLIKVII